MNILTENEINIKSLEKEFYYYACRLAAEAFANYLQALDQELRKSRDKELLRHKGHRKTCIKILMGEVEYSRAVYQVRDNECEKKFVYLLDELFEYLDSVANSLENKNAEERVRRLLNYLRDNRNGLVPYQQRDLNLPKLPDGLFTRVWETANIICFLW